MNNHLDPNYLIKRAALASNHEELARLVGLANGGSVAVALNVAAEKGDVECLKVLYRYANDNGRKSALTQAARWNKTEAVLFLSTQPHAKQSEDIAVQWSIQHQNKEMLLSLIPLSGIQMLRDMSKQYSGEKNLQFIEECLAQHEKNIILQQLPDASCARQARKI